MIRDFIFSKNSLIKVRVKIFSIPNFHSLWNFRKKLGIFQFPRKFLSFLKFKVYNLEIGNSE